MSIEQASTLIWWAVMLPALTISATEQWWKRHLFKRRFGYFNDWEFTKFTWLSPIYKWYRRRVIAYACLIWGSYFTLIVLLIIKQFR